MDVFDLVAKIRLDSSEYEQGVGKAKGTFSTLASGVKTGLATVAKVGAAAVTAGVAGVTALTKMGVEGYAQYEQLVGGVETLFGTGGQSIKEFAEASGKNIADVAEEWYTLDRSQKTVLSNASNAYKTAGMSANEYMETVTSFSASLIQSLGGDTEKAASVADMAITDMSDNANKMGTSMEMIQNAYNGFAKGNYTMLDNLKLGYGGTQEEMKRLLKDAEKISGIKYDISSFSDVTEAIHVMQEEMGIAGTTAREAASTIEGSLSMMKGAWQNLVVGMADENANMDVLINNFVESVGTAAQNLIPRIEQVLSGIGQLIEKLAPIIAEALPVLVEKLLPAIITAGISLVAALANAIVTSLPAIKTALEEGLVIILTNVFGVSEENARGFVDKLNDVWAKLVDAFDKVRDGFSKVSEFAGKLWENCQPLVSLIRDNLLTAFDGLKEPLANIKDAFNDLAPILGGVLAGAVGTAIGLFNGIISAASGVAEMVAGVIDIFVGFVQAIVGYFTGSEELMTDAANNIVDGVIGVFGGLWDGVVGFLTGFVDGVVEFFYGLWDTLVGHSIVPDTIDGIVNCFGELWGKVSKFVKDFCSNVTSIFTKLWENVKQATQKFLDTAKSVISSGLDKIKTVFTAAWNAIKNTVSTYLDAIKNVITTVWNNIKNIVSTVIDSVKNVINTAWNAIKTIIANVMSAISSAIKGNWEGVRDSISNIINAIKSVISSVWNGIKSVISSVMDGIKNTISSVWNGIKSTISSVIDGVKSTISSGLNGALSSVSTVLGNIKSKFSSIFDGCKTIVKDAVTALKNALKFNWELPKLKLPHISVKGGKAPYGIGGKGSLPSFSIEWYKKAYDNAMILSKPTIFGYSAASGKFLGGGDGNGNEIVAGESYLMGLISNAVESKNEKIVALLSALLEATVDGNTETVRALRADRIFAVGEREFARLVKQYA